MNLTITFGSSLLIVESLCEIYLTLQSESDHPIVGLFLFCVLFYLLLLLLLLLLLFIGLVHHNHLDENLRAMALKVSSKFLPPMDVALKRRIFGREKLKVVE